MMPASPALIASTLFLLLFPVAEIVAPVLMLAAARPRREPFARRAAIVFGVVAVVALVVSPLAYFTIMGSADPEGYNRIYSLASSVVILVSLVPIAMSLYETSVWQALFFAGAGYTIQNLASGTREFLKLLLSHYLGISAGFSMQTGINVENAPATAFITFFPVLLVYTIAYLAFIRPARRESLGNVEDHGMLVVLILVILVVISFDVLIKSLGNVTGFPALVALRGVHGVVCCFVLFVQFEILSKRSLELELAQNQRIASERERQYQLSRANIDAINVKCHDIRHQIHQAATGGKAVDPEFLASVEREVAVYDSQAKTGNEALDTILTEKGLLCEREGISLSVIADGSALVALSPSEVYSLFGNALDNAIEAVCALADPGQRSISLTVRQIGSLATIHVENYLAGEAHFSDGIPQTSKHDSQQHGFGTRSMREIVERHGGTLTFGQRGRTFTVDAMIPAPLERKG